MFLMFLTYQLKNLSFFFSSTLFLFFAVFVLGLNCKLLSWHKISLFLGNKSYRSQHIPGVSIHKNFSEMRGGGCKYVSQNLGGNFVVFSIVLSALPPPHQLMCLTQIHLEDILAGWGSVSVTKGQTRYFELWFLMI